MQVNNTHLTYCTNIHPGESWAEHFAAIKKYFPEIKKNVFPGCSMGIGLRLSNAASLELIKKEKLEEFKQWLASEDLFVFTMNGFPYGNFHNDKVKDQVHAPDWSTDERVEYTVRLFNILKELLPEGMEGGISTSPLSYRYWARTVSLELLNMNILCVLKLLVYIKQETGKTLHLDIEPEPDGLLESGTEFISWYNNSLLQTAKGFCSEEEVKEHIRLCYDVCHFAIGYEDHDAVIGELKRSGIKVGKIQISAALKAGISGADKKTIASAFNDFNESTYLHQVVARTQSGDLVRYRDLPEALNDLDRNDVEEWRSHFHVPVFLKSFGKLDSTQQDIIDVLELNSREHFTDHLEVETYTWEVLPPDLKLPMDESITRELNWVKEQLDRK